MNVVMWHLESLKSHLASYWCPLRQEGKEAIGVAT